MDRKGHQIPKEKREIIGWTHKIYGKCVAVGYLKDGDFSGGERYYWFVKGNDVSRIPARTIEEIS